MPTELIPVANVLLVPSGVNLRMERRFFSSVAAPSDTRRFRSWSKHKPRGYVSFVAKLLFVPSGMYLKTECLGGSTAYRLPVASKASPPQWALEGINIIAKPIVVRPITALFIYLSIPIVV